MKGLWDNTHQGWNNSPGPGLTRRRLAALHEAHGAPRSRLPRTDAERAAVSAAVGKRARRQVRNQRQAAS